MLERPQRDPPRRQHHPKSLHLSLGDHAGTHVDAPCHFNSDPNAPSIDQVPLENFYTEAVCLDLSHVPLKHEITVAELEAAEQAAGLRSDRVTRS